MTYTSYQHSANIAINRPGINNIAVIVTDVSRNLSVDKVPACNITTPNFNDLPPMLYPHPREKAEMPLSILIIAESNELDHDLSPLEVSLFDLLHQLLNGVL